MPKLQKSDDYTRFFNTLIDLCNQYDTSPTAISERFTGSKNSTSTWRTSGKIETETIIQIANYFKVSPEYLLTGNSDSNILSPEQTKLINYFDEMNDREQQRLLGYAESIIDSHKESTIEIKFCTYKVAAGVKNDGFELEEYESMDTMTVTDTLNARDCDFAIQVSGDSMLPEYEDGDIVLIKSSDSADVNQIVVFSLNNQGFIKKVGNDRFISLNPNYDDIIPQENDTVVIKGYVIGKL